MIMIMIIMTSTILPRSTLRKANTTQLTKKFPAFMETKGSFPVHNSPSRVLSLRPKNPVHSLTLYFFQTRFGDDVNDDNDIFHPWSPILFLPTLI
jgi:hypothetical protein